ncbi:DUF488 domain-containing protein [Dictyobacter arantiisoli]|uniref:DUF488 domain-containing protein n=1 Tax=Dictyobacter arantiisoli TaxID=2014874 RepID=A0A5A5TAS4_9CHLR|nr:DUF488 domain-containing protein [Dictyobacter arantiisoli]GCF08089.1 hypothetical protein KDI_16530 [Dictyobacter arantiisoli]
MSKVFTLGYAARKADEQLDKLMVDPSMILIDIRLSPKSRFHPRFRGPALAQRFGNQYHHVRELGNLNYQDHALPIVLADAPGGLSLVSFWMERGYPVCLLCACSNAASCHRSVVARLLQEKFVYDCEVVHF